MGDTILYMLYLKFFIVSLTITVLAVHLLLQSVGRIDSIFLFFVELIFLFLSVAMLFFLLKKQTSSSSVVSESKTDIVTYKKFYTCLIVIILFLYIVSIIFSYFIFSGDGWWIILTPAVSVVLGVPAIGTIYLIYYKKIRTV